MLRRFTDFSQQTSKRIFSSASPTPPIITKCMIYKDAIKNKQLLNDMASILSPVYSNDPLPVILLDAERNCPRLYTIWAEDGNSPTKEQLVGFMGYGRIDVELPGNAAGGKSPVYYLGLGSVASVARKWKIPEILAHNFHQDLKYFLPAGKEVWAFFTSAVPTGTKAGFDVFTNGEGYPRLDGSYPEEAVAVARAIAKVKGWEHQLVGDYPFLLRKARTYIQFTEEEILRTEQICAKNNITVFQKAGVNIREGDRVLFVGKITV